MYGIKNLRDITNYQMGWHYILRFQCKVLPEFIPFIENRYFNSQYDSDNDIHYRDTPCYSNYDISDSDDEYTKRYKAHLQKRKKEKVEESKKREKEYELLSKSYRDLVDIWVKLNIGCHFYEYTLKDEIFTCKISKKVTWHSGDLREEYLEFLHDIIVPISSEILSCEIESDDYGDMKWHYTDYELRIYHLF